MATKRRSKPKRDHIPALNELELQAALVQLQAMSGLTAAGRTAIEGMLRAAANPNAEKPETLIKMLPLERQHNIAQLSSALRNISSSATQRGAQALMAMSPAEWEALVNGANYE